MAEEQKIGSPMEQEILSDSEIDSDSDSDEELKKLEHNETKNILVDFHPHLKHISNKEMYALSKITRNKAGNIVDPLHTTLPILTRYEKAKVIGIRAKQINLSSPLKDH